MDRHSIFVVRSNYPVTFISMDKKKKLKSEGWKFGDVADFLCIPEEERAEFWEVAEKYGGMIGKSVQEVIQQDVENILDFEKSVFEWGNK